MNIRFGICILVGVGLGIVAFMIGRQWSPYSVPQTAQNTTMNTTLPKSPDDGTSPNDTKIIHLFYGLDLAQTQPSVSSKPPAFVVKRQVFRVIEVRSPLFSSGSLIVEAWQAQLDRLDGDDPKGVPVHNKYEFYYDANSIGEIKVGQIIVISFDQYGRVDSVEKYSPTEAIDRE